MRPASGRIVCDGSVWFDSAEKVNVPPQQRGIGMVFQELALFPHMTVRQNILFAMPGGGNASMLDELLTAVAVRVQDE